MPNERKTIRVRSRKDGQIYEIPFETTTEDPTISQNPGALLRPGGGQKAVQESKLLNLQEEVEKAMGGLPQPSFQERFPNLGRDIQNIVTTGAGVGTAAATGGMSLPMQVLLGLAANYGTGEITSGLGKKAGYDMPSSGENLRNAILGEGVGLGTRGAIKLVTEGNALRKVLTKKADPTTVGSDFIGWLASRYLPKQGKLPVRNPLAPALQEAEGVPEQWGSELQVLKLLKDNNYPLMTSQATSSSKAAKLEAMNPRLEEKVAKQNLKMEDIAKTVSSTNLYETPVLKGEKLERETIKKIADLVNKATKSGDQSKIDEAISLAEGRIGQAAGKSSLDDAANYIKDPAKSFSIALEDPVAYDQFFRIHGKKKSSEYLREQLLMNSFDQTNGVFNGEAARKFIRDHSDKFLKTLKSEERHAINTFINALDVQARRRGVLNYVPAAQMNGESQLTALMGATAVAGTGVATNVVASRQGAALAAIRFDHKVLSKLLADPKFAYAAARMTQVKGGTSSTRGPLKTMLAAAARAGVNVQMLRLDGVEQNVTPLEGGKILKLNDGRKIDLDNLYDAPEK